MSHLRVFSIFLACFLLTSVTQAAGDSELDPILADTLKIEANHNINRLKSLRSEKLNNQVFEKEREKGLGEFLEDQEKWDLVRERGLSEYRREKKLFRSPVEGGLDYEADNRKKRQADYLYEQSREIHARTKRKIESQFRFDVDSLEMQELGLNEKLPRYDLRRRSQNKWVNSGGRSSGTSFSGSGAGGSFQNTPAPVEFPPAPDFPPAPAPYEGYDENVQAPPMDSSGGVPYDPSFGTDMSIPPPPPPPPDYDF